MRKASKYGWRSEATIVAILVIFVLGFITSLYLSTTFDNIQKEIRMRAMYTAAEVTQQEK